MEIKTKMSRDHYGKFATRKDAVPAKMMRSFLVELQEEFGNVPLQVVIDHYEAMRLRKLATSEPAAAVESPMQYTHEQWLDMMFKADTNLPYTMYVILKPENPRAIERMQEYVHNEIGDQAYDWVSPEEFHVTLLRVDCKDEDKLADLAMELNYLNDKVAIATDGLGVFRKTNNDGKDALYLAVERTPDLTDLQQKLYGYAYNLEVESISDFSDPRTWTPHITIAYSAESIDDTKLPDVGGIATASDEIIASIDMQEVNSSTTVPKGI